MPLDYIQDGNLTFNCKTATFQYGVVYTELFIPLIFSIDINYTQELISIEGFNTEFQKDYVHLYGSLSYSGLSAYTGMTDPNAPTGTSQNFQELVLAITDNIINSCGSSIGSINTLSDVNTLGAAIGDILIWDGSNWDTQAQPAAIISANSVDNTMLADIPTSTITGRVAAGTGDPSNLTPLQVKTLLNYFIDDLGDVDTISVSPNIGEVLSWDGSNWVPSVVTASVSDNSISNTKLSDVAQNTIKGRTSVGVGDPEDLTATQVKNILAYNIDELTDVDTTTSTPTIGQTLTWDGSNWTPSTPFTSVADDSVTNTKLADVNTNTLKGRVSAGVGDPEDLTVVQAKSILNYIIDDLADVDTTTGTPIVDNILKWDGSNWVPGTITDASITNNSITNVKLANVASTTLRGRVSAGSGSIENLSVAQVKSMLSYNINDITDVDTSTVSPISGQVLTWDGSNWVPNTVSTSIGDNTVTNLKLADISQNTIKGRISSGVGDPEDLTAVQVKSILGYILNDITDVDTVTTAPSTNDVLTWNGATWVPQAGGGGGSTTFAALTDTTISGIAQGDITYWNGSAWVNLAIGTANQKLSVNSGATAPEWVDGINNIDEVLSLTQALTTARILEFSGINTLTLGDSLGANNGATIVFDEDNQRVEHNDWNTKWIVASNSIEISPSVILWTNNAQSLTLGVQNLTGSYGINLPANQGAANSILVNDGIGTLFWTVYSIDNLSDVDTSTAAPTTNQVLTWDGSNWVPANPTGTLVSLTDTIITAPTNGQYLTYNGSAWVNSSLGSIDSLSDVDTSSVAPSTRSGLIWDSTNWVPTFDIGNYRGSYATSPALNSAVPSPNTLDWAIVSGVIYIEDTGAWESTDIDVYNVLAATATNLETDTNFDSGNKYTGPAIAAEDLIPGKRYHHSTLDSIEYFCSLDTEWYRIDRRKPLMDIGGALGTETDDADTGVKLTVHIPHDGYIEKVFLSSTTGPIGSAAIIDVHLDGTTLFSTRPQIDDGDDNSSTSATPFVLTTSPTAVTAGQKLEFEIDQIGSTTAGQGYKAIISYRLNE